MKVGITGASGFIGQSLIPFLTTQGHTVIPFERPRDWDPEKKIINLEKFEGLDAVINLAGESIMGLWSEAKKSRILKSRVDSSAFLSESLAKLKNKPKVLINASAIGFYGDRGDETLTEKSTAGNNFLSEVCVKWENATKAATDAEIRVVNLRTGLVLSKKGGALKSMLIPFKLGLGGVIGSGNQYWSYISLDDHLAIILHALVTPSIHGPLNAVAPDPVTNETFTKTLGKVLNRPTVLPLPTFLVNLIFGQMGKECFLASERVEPAVLFSTNFSHKHDNLEDALRTILD
jgi:uncharacterized protein (TIGR01777 family)